MKILKDNSFHIDERCILALGNFDGIHLGHRALLEKAVRLAGKNALKAGVYTFNVNTKSFLGARDFSLLTTDEEKNEIFEHFGVDFVFYDNFSKVKDFSPEDFCRYITDKFKVTAVVCGENFTFGKGACAGAFNLKELMSSLGVDTYIIPDYKIDGVHVSSTAIRNFIRSGDMESAEKFLGYPYFIRTTVIHGAQLGRKLGFPTINQLEYQKKAIPKFGVYSCVCTIDGKNYMGVVNVGIRPTVSSGKQNPPVIFETHILDYSGDAYGKDVTVKFCKMLREEKKFSSLEELTENVMNNISQTRDYFSSGKPAEKLLSGFYSPADK